MNTEILGRERLPDRPSNDDTPEGEEGNSGSIQGTCVLAAEVDYDTYVLRVEES